MSNAITCTILYKWLWKLDVTIKIKEKNVQKLKLFSWLTGVVLGFKENYIIFKFFENNIYIHI